MNQAWKSFLYTRGAVVIDDNQVSFNKNVALDTPWICSLSDIGVISFTGSDSSAFLQGQITCDIDQVTDSQTSLGAYCNPKGRATAIFRIIKAGQSFYWLLPSVLIPGVIKKLRMYVLRSKVLIENVSDYWCILGISAPSSMFSAFDPENNKQPSEEGSVRVSNNMLVIKPSSFSDRLLILADAKRAEHLWIDFVNSKGYMESDSAFWKEMDLKNGIPSLTKETSEQFIPQMLNLDLLGGISFSKGCYTGQEIIARTHNLGKLKRRMFLACCESTEKFAANTPIYDGDAPTGQSVGHVIAVSELNLTSNLMLVVLQISIRDHDNIRIQNPAGKRLKIIKLPYTD